MRRGAPLLLALVWRPSWCCGPSRRRSSGSARLSDRRTEAHRALTSVTPARAASDLALPQLAGAPRASRSCAPAVFPKFGLRPNGEDASSRDRGAGARRMAGGALRWPSDSA